MANPYPVILTDAGAVLLTAALVGGPRVTLTHFALGDGGGVVYDPVASQGALRGERYRAAINSAAVDPDNPAWLRVEGVVPATEGGWHVREIGLFSSTGVLVAIAKYPETYKPKLADGMGYDILVELALEHTGVAAVTLLVDPSVVTATRKYVDDSLAASAARCAPPGTVIFHAASTPPAGWLAADGSLISRTAYGILFSAIGTTFGAGDGATTFQLPDLRGEFVCGWDAGRGVDGGRVFGSFEADGVAPHTHSGFYLGELQRGVAYGAGGPAGAIPPTGNTGSWPPTDTVAHDGDPAHALRTLTTPDAVPHTRPRNYALLACIKY